LLRQAAETFVQCAHRSDDRELAFPYLFGSGRNASDRMRWPTTATRSTRRSCSSRTPFWSHGCGARRGVPTYPTSTTTSSRLDDIEAIWPDEERGRRPARRRRSRCPCAPPPKRCSTPVTSASRRSSNADPPRHGPMRKVGPGGRAAPRLQALEPKLRVRRASSSASVARGGRRLRARVRFGSPGYVRSSLLGFPDTRRDAQGVEPHRSSSRTVSCRKRSR
jgi:hypothetical protein